MSDLNVTVSASKIEDIADSLGANDFEIMWAIKDAANYAARRAQRIGAASLHDGLDVEAATLRRRLKLTAAQGVRRSGRVRYSSAKAAKVTQARARVWFGLNPIDPFELSTPPAPGSDVRTRSQGVIAGRYHWGNAFIAKGKVGTGGAGRLFVFMRKRKSRLPLARQFADINAKALSIISSPEVFGKVEVDFYRRFESTLIKEIENGRFRK